MKRRSSHYVMLNVKGGIMRVDVADIYYVESSGHNLIYHTANGDRLLAAPIHEKGVTAREVCIPKGKWKLGEAVLESSGEKMMLEQKEGHHGSRP